VLRHARSERRGKTTTVEIFEGLREPDSGEVEVLGERWKGDGIALRSRLGIQLQETKFQDKLTVAEVMTLFRSFYPRGLERRRGTDAGLAGREGRLLKVRTLSAAQSSACRLPAALIGDPEVLFSTSRPPAWTRSRAGSSGMSCRPTRAWPPTGAAHDALHCRKPRSLCDSSRGCRITGR
jgi:hypothetical protein